MGVPVFSCSLSSAAFCCSVKYRLNFFMRPPIPYYLRDAASFQGRFDEILTPVVRRAVTSQRIDSTTCEAAAFMYGNGEVWVSSSAHGYGISTVNVPQRAQPKISTSRLEFACRTDKYWVLIDKDSDGTQRLRAWNKGRLLSQKPNTELVGGKKASATHNPLPMQRAQTVNKKLGRGPRPRRSSATMTSLHLPMSPFTWFPGQLPPETGRCLHQECGNTVIP